jgi:hypothetical protein
MMMKTLVTDGFEDKPKTTDDETIHVDSGDPHNIVYGALGHTDSLSDESIALLVEAGVIVRDREVSGPGWQTRIYLSVQGNPPA